MYREDWYDKDYPSAREGVYYKATRPNGTDFRTGRVLYEVGKRVRPLPHVGPRSICGPGYLHAADVPGMTLVGGHWPCRLFEVTGRPAVGFDAYRPHKGGFRQLTVSRELPAHWALGPNGLIVSKVIERSRKITRVEAQNLLAGRVAAWDAAAARVAGRVAAWDAAGVAAGAIVMQDALTNEQFSLLFAPWKKVIGEDFA